MMFLIFCEWLFFHRLATGRKDTQEEIDYFEKEN